MEGFAEYFAQVVAAKNPAGTFQGHAGGAGTFTVAQLENTPWAGCTLPPGVTPKMTEHFVAGVLWDLFDGVGACGTSEAHDALADFDTVVIQILDHELDFPPPFPSGPTIDHFIAAWLARSLPKAARNGRCACWKPKSSN